MENFNEMSVSVMGRPEVVEALRSYAHPSWFRSILDWPTPTLKALLFFYREQEREEEGSIDRTKKYTRSLPPFVDTDFISKEIAELRTKDMIAISHLFAPGVMAAGKEIKIVSVNHS